MTRRPLIRLATIASGMAVVGLVSTAPAMATIKVPGQHYSSLGVLNTVLLFVVVPLGIFAVVAGLALLPSAISQRRYAKNTEPWDYSPVWIGGPANPRGLIAGYEAADAAAHEAQTERLAQAATAAASTELSADDAAEADVASVVSVRGGASAEW